jgi:hypothetical protein
MMIGVATLMIASSTQLFRRDRDRPQRAEAFRDLFNALGCLYEAAAQLKPEWRELWRDRHSGDLPPRFQFEDAIATDASYDLRFATTLLRRYRWKSVVQPLFETIDEPSWSRFSAAAGRVSPSLLAVVDDQRGLRQDELDWINTAVEQFDEATRRRHHASRDGLDRPRQIAEGTYQPLYIAIQLSDRLIERLRYDAGQQQ